MSSRIVTAEDAYAKANELFVDEEYDKAKLEYEEAIELANAAALKAKALDKKSACNLKLENFKGVYIIFCKIIFYM